MSSLLVSYPKLHLPKVCEMLQQTEDETLRSRIAESLVLSIRAFDETLCLYGKGLDRKFHDFDILIYFYVCVYSPCLDASNLECLPAWWNRHTDVINVHVELHV